MHMTPRPKLYVNIILEKLREHYAVSMSPYTNAYGCTVPCFTIVFLETKVMVINDGLTKVLHYIQSHDRSKIATISYSDPKLFEKIFRKIQCHDHLPSTSAQ